MANLLKMAQVHAIETLRARGWSYRRIGRALGVLRFQAGKPATLQPVVLHIADASFHLPLVAGHPGLGRQGYDPVVLAEGLHLRVDLGIEPVGLAHRRPQVVQHQRLRHTAEVPECVLQAADELVGRLPVHRLAVSKVMSVP